MRLEWIRQGVLVLLAAATSSPGVDRGGPDQSDRIAELLQLPAPLPSWSEPHVTPTAATVAGSYVSPAPPGADAPLDVLAGYWAERAAFSRGEEPTEAVQERLLEACVEDPSRLPSLLRLLPDAPETHDRIGQLLSEPEALSKLGEGATPAREWLRRRSGWLREDLVRSAREATDDAGGWVDGKEDLEALARLDWAQADSILRDHIHGEAPRTSALALAVAHEHYASAGKTAEAAGYRERLQAVVSDGKAPGWARDRAFESLMRTTWSGRDEWYLSLFADPTLADLLDGHVLYSPLLTPVRSEPDRWIPVVAGLVGHPNRVVHDAAVGCLIQFHLRDARADALRPLLPWLGDPNWSSARDRLRLIQSVADLAMPESRAGLIWAVANDPDDTNRAYAGQSLAAYPDPSALPALHSALAKDGSEHHRSLVLEGLLACGPNEDEQVAAVEAYAQQTATPEGGEKYDRANYDLRGENPLPIEVSTGAYLSRGDKAHPDNVVVRLLDRVHELQRSSPHVGTRLREIVDSWPGEVVTRSIFNRLAAGRADALTIAAALERRSQIRVTSEAFRSLLDQGGEERGIAAVLLGDRKIESEVLEGTDPRAQRALLASARLAGAPLPIPLVARLFRTDDPALAVAAESYLVSEDSAEARRTVLARHAREALILGRRSRWDPGHDTFSAFDAWEDRLRQEVLHEGGPDEVLALLTAGYWGDAGQVVIRIRGQRAELTHHEDEAHTQRRTLTSRELGGLRGFLSDNHVDDLPPLNTAVADGMQYEFLRLSRDGGRRVFMNNPGFGGSGGSVYHLLRDRMEALVETGDLAAHGAAVP